MSGQFEADTGLGCATLSAIVVPAALVSTLIALLTGDVYFFLAATPVIFMFGLPIAAVHVVVLALPLYLFLRVQVEVPWWGAAAAGLVCGGLPTFLISKGDTELLAWFGGAGLVGGLAFHFTLRWERMR